MAALETNKTEVMRAARANPEISEHALEAHFEAGDWWLTCKSCQWVWIAYVELDGIGFNTIAEGEADCEGGE